jgi:hypothetical protein
MKVTRNLVLFCLLAMLATAGAAGCGGTDEDHDGDSPDGDAADAPDGDADGDAADTDADAPDLPDGTVACFTDFDCDNGFFCDGQERCVEGSCRMAERPECLDDEPCTIESCDESTRTCNYELDDSQCDDGLICNGLERCSAMHGCIDGTVPDCTDDNICTVDLCIEERGGCIHDWRDLDNDTYIDENCDGDDCNDRDAEINPGMDEICDDSKDNNCDMHVDMSDEDCRPENDTCSAPTLLTEDVEIHGSTYGTTNNYDSDMCYIYSERDVVFRIDLAEELDLLVSLTTLTAGYVNASIQTICGSNLAELICQETSSSMTIRRNRLPAGTYYVVVWTDHEGEFTISYDTDGPTPRPAVDTCAGAADVSAGGIFSGSTRDCVNDYSPSCASTAAFDTFYTFTITEPRKIGLNLLVLSGWPTLRLALMTVCGDAGTEVVCQSSYGSTSINRNFLDAGTYWIAVDIASETDYTLTVTFEEAIYPPPNDRCDGAIDISGGGLFVGNLMESYRDYVTSCSLSTHTDVAYVFTTSTTRDVFLTLSPVGAASDMALAVVTDCSNMASEVQCNRANPATLTLSGLAAGTYYVIVSGTLHGSGSIRGRYLLEAVF